ncbi:MAG: ABC transporter permease [Pseudorhodoplanes sp.]
MFKFLVRRLALGVVTWLAVSVLVFAATEILPGDVAEAVLGQNAAPDTLAALRKQLGLDTPAPLRYLHWLGNIATGDLGSSLASQRSVAETIGQHLPKTIWLGAATAVISVPIAIILGLIAAMFPGSLYDRTITAATLCLISGPEFLIATLLVMFFAVWLQWLPAVAFMAAEPSFLQLLQALTLPVLTLSAAIIAPMTRMTRSAVLNVLGSPAIEMAILKGVPRYRIILRHALPNALAPVFSVIAISLAYLVSGVVVVEVVFAYPGMAKLMVDSVSYRDIPMVQACAMIFCTVYVGLNLLADIFSVALNPRLRHPR